jgi:hypothetical protein
VIGNIATLVGGCTALVAAIAAFVWWIYRRGLEAGRTQARLERLEDEVRKRRTRLQTRGHSQSGRRHGVQIDSSASTSDESAMQRAPCISADIANQALRRANYRA